MIFCPATRARIPFEYLKYRFMSPASTFFQDIKQVLTGFSHEFDHESGRSVAEEIEQLSDIPGRNKTHLTTTSPSKVARFTLKGPDRQIAHALILGDVLTTKQAIAGGLFVLAAIYLSVAVPTIEAAWVASILMLTIYLFAFEVVDVDC